MVDGCATFYRTSKFEVVQEYTVNYKDLMAKTLQDVISFHRNDIKSRLEKDNVASATVFRSLQGGHHSVCIANTHIIANKDLMLTKLWQVAQLVRGLLSLKNEVPTILCGDFNSHENSNPIRLIKGEKLLPGAADLKHYAPIGLFNRCSVANGLNLVSASTLEERYRLDYVFFDETALAVRSFLEEQEIRNLKERRGLPSMEWSSDHYALGFEFSYRGPATQPSLPAFLW